jgi:hypothetical protein
VGRLDQIVVDAEPKVSRFLDTAVEAAEGFASLAKDAAALGPDAKALLQGLDLDAEEFMQVLIDTARNLQDASEDIRAHPWKLLNEPKPGEIAFENLRLASLSYMRAMREMNRASAQIVRLLGRDELPQEEIKSLLAEAVAAFRASQERYAAAEQRFYQLLEEGTRRR